MYQVFMIVVIAYFLCSGLAQTISLINEAFVAFAMLKVPSITN